MAERIEAIPLPPIQTGVSIMTSIAADAFVTMIVSGFGLFAVVIGYQSLADNLRRGH